MPINADAVVMYEDTRRSGDYVEVLRPVPPMGNVSRRGEDVRANEVMYRRGGMKILLGFRGSGIDGCLQG